MLQLEQPLLEHLSLQLIEKDMLNLVKKKPIYLSIRVLNLSLLMHSSQTSTCQKALLLCLCQRLLEKTELLKYTTKLLEKNIDFSALETVVSSIKEDLWNWMKCKRLHGKTS